MTKGPSSWRARDLALLVSGAMDLLLGTALVLLWVGVLPVDLNVLDIPRGVAGGVGMVLFISGAAMIAWTVSQPRPPE